MAPKNSLLLNHMCMCGVVVVVITRERKSGRRQGDPKKGETPNRVRVRVRVRASSREKLVCATLRDALFFFGLLCIRTRISNLFTSQNCTHVSTHACAIGCGGVRRADHRFFPVAARTAHCQGERAPSIGAALRRCDRSGCSTLASVETQR